MTITLPEPVTVQPARTLVPAGLFGRLTARIVADHGLDWPMAERIMTEALAYLRAAATATEPLSPSETVDIGWHTFLLYTREYAAFCQRVAGQFIHHVPDDDPDEPAAGDGHEVLRRTVAALTATGHAVDAELWMPVVASRCNSGGGGSGTGKCSQCHAGCVNSPR